MTQSKKIAVTGGIGSGKTTACRILEGWGFPVLSCDEISRGLWRDEGYLETLADAFPDCTVGGKIDKARLTGLIFSDTAARKRLESLAHPRIMRELMSEMEGLPVCFAEVPLLFEGGYEGLFDAVIVVRRREEARISSVMARDGATEEEVKGRLSAQLSDGEREREGVIVIDNDGSFEDLAIRLRGALQALGLS